ncbi:hypothetical protein NW765_016869 [Fusarium oxysporum]|nr:hypothetical protein NW765_016869 [Fusarium oxysporum]
MRVAEKDDREVRRQEGGLPPTSTDQTRPPSGTGPRDLLLAEPMAGRPLFDIAQDLTHVYSSYQNITEDLIRMEGQIRAQRGTRATHRQTYRPTGRHHDGPTTTRAQRLRGSRARYSQSTQICTTTRPLFHHRRTTPSCKAV